MFIVIELQTTGNEVGSLINKYSNRNEADSKFYQIMSNAAVSNVEKHAAVLVTDEGSVLRSGCYEHLTTEE